MVVNNTQITLWLSETMLDKFKSKCNALGIKYNPAAAFLFKRILSSDNYILSPEAMTADESTYFFTRLSNETIEAIDQVAENRSAFFREACLRYLDDLDSLAKDQQEIEYRIAAIPNKLQELLKKHKNKGNAIIRAAVEELLSSGEEVNLSEKYPREVRKRVGLYQQQFEKLDEMAAQNRVAVIWSDIFCYALTKYFEITK